MRVTNLVEGINLYHINKEANRVKQCTYIYTNKNGKKYVSFISKRGELSYTFLPKETHFYDTEEDAEEEIGIIKDNILKEEIRRKEIDIEVKEGIEKGRIFLREIFSQVENINMLPFYDELVAILDAKSQEYDPEEVIFEAMGETFIISDGTEVRIDYEFCFDSERDYNIHDRLYYIPEIDTYKCMMCGLWQKIDPESLEGEYNFITKFVPKRFAK